MYKTEHTYIYSQAKYHENKLKFSNNNLKRFLGAFVPHTTGRTCETGKPQSMYVQTRPAQAVSSERKVTSPIYLPHPHEAHII